MPKSTVSRKVTELETRLKARLLNRTTRKVSLTDVGRTYYDYCARIVGEIEDAERAVSNLQEVPRGVLRVDHRTERDLPGPDLERLHAPLPRGADRDVLHFAGCRLDRGALRRRPPRGRAQRLDAGRPQPRAA